ncbi:MAG: hypothetical protein ACO3ZY_02950, partial [Phycisphaerales bacterium]
MEHFAASDDDRRRLLERLEIALEQVGGHLYEMRRTAPAMTLENLQQGFQQNFDTVQELKREAGIGDEVSTFNMMATDGERIIGTRYSSDPERETRTLYYATGSRFECVDGLSRMAQDEDG